MKYFLVKVAILNMVLLIIFGCTLEKKFPQQANNESERFNKPESQYYYFIEAQLEKNKGNLDKAILLLKKAITEDAESLYLQRELAGLYAQHKEYANALQVLKKILEKHPNDVETLILFGRIKQASKDNDGARQAYEKVISLDKTRKAIYLRLGGVFLQEGHTASALKVFQDLIRNFPDSYPGHFFLGTIYTKTGKFRQAEKEFKKALELKPELVEPRFELLGVYESQGKKQEILNIYKDILDKHPNNIRAALELGYLYHKNGRLDEAQRLFADLGARSLQEFEVILKVIQIYIDTKRYDDAVIVLEGMLKGAPESSDLHYIEGVAFYGNNNNDKAMRAFKKVKPRTRFFQDAAVHISYLYQEQGNINTAIDFLKDVLKNDPENPEFMYYLGTFYEESEKYEAAEQYLKQAIGIEPERAKFYFRLGVVYDKWGHKEKSMEAMKTTIKLDPKHANALNYLGYTYADLGRNLDEAERLIKEALKYKPNDGYITDSLGWVYYKKGRYQEALKLLIRAIELVPDDPIMLEHLGDTYLKTNDEKNALKYYRQSLKNKKKDTEELEKKIQNLLN
jgi:tetratricopeptide (TPR) repeat protein